MTTSETQLTEAQIAEYFADVERSNLAPLWRLQTMSREPRTQVEPYLWRWEDLYSRLQRAGEIMKPAAVQDDGAAERRVLLMINPGMKQHRSTTNTLVAGMQYIFPGEVAPAHRHTAGALRFMIQGHGAYTTVDGVKAAMAPGDLVLTPQWRWHDHGNDSDEPIVWLDTVDRVLVANLNAVFFDPSPVGRQSVTDSAESAAGRYGPTNVRPAWEPLPVSPSNSPQVIYKWRETADALRQLADQGASGPTGEVEVAYINPETGGHVTPTMGCTVLLLRPGARTRAKRRTGSAVYHVVQGRGSTVINGRRFHWQKGDSFALPPWSWYEHASESDEESFLFAITDLPLFHALGLYREELYEANGGHQQVAEDVARAS